MESVQTKETSNALAALSKHKNRANKPVNVAVQPVAVMVEGSKIEAAATSDQAPANPPATPAQNPEPQVTNTRNYEEAWKHLKTKYDTEISQSRQTEKQLRDDLAKASAPRVELPKTKAEIEEYRKKYPEAMDVFTTIALETVSANSKELKDQLAEINKFQTELKEKEAFKKLLDIHPDAMDIRASASFLTWFNEQPRVIQQILESSTDITAVAKQLTLYKLEVLGINPKAKKAEEVKSVVTDSLGVNVSGRTEITAQKKIWTQTEINNICANYNDYLKHRVEIDDARREGRVDTTK